MLIYNILFVNKKKIGFFNNLTKFAELRINSNKGDFLFTFKEDRRKPPKYMNRFIVEVNVPVDTTDALQTLNDQLAIIINVALIRVDYDILAELLYEKYLDEAIKYLKSI